MAHGHSTLVRQYVAVRGAASLTPARQLTPAGRLTVHDERSHRFRRDEKDRSGAFGGGSKAPDWLAGGGSDSNNRRQNTSRCELDRNVGRWCAHGVLAKWHHGLVEGRYDGRRREEADTSRRFPPDVTDLVRRHRRDECCLPL